MQMPSSGGHKVKCDCCHRTIKLRQALYDTELNDFVCGNCAIDLNAATWALIDSGYTDCTWKQIQSMPTRPGYEGFNI